MKGARPAATQMPQKGAGESPLARAWRALDPAWQHAILAYLGARVLFFTWSMVVLALFPTVVQNLTLYGAPELAVFDLASSERYAYSRRLDGMDLTFRSSGAAQATDAQTGSLWSPREGRALSGPLAGRSLDAAWYSAEDIFPYRGVPPDRVALFALWQRFDTNWYLAIAAQGYIVEGSTVYMPLYPLLVSVLQRVTVSPMFAALMVSNLALVGALALLYRLAVDVLGTEPARRTLAFFLLFPTSFFLFGAYTESLFLLLALAALLSARRERWLLAALFGALAALTRLQGVVLLIPLAYLWWRGRRDWWAGAGLVLIPAVTALFLALTSLSLLNTYESQLHARFVWPWENIAAALSLVGQGGASPVDLLNLAATLGFGALLIPLWRRLPREFGLLALAMFLAPLFRMTTTQPLVSMTRYVLAVVPAFMLFGVWGRNPWVTRALLYLGFPLALYLCAQFLLWGWVA